MVLRWSSFHDIFFFAAISSWLQKVWSLLTKEERVKNEELFCQSFQKQLQQVWSMIENHLSAEKRLSWESISGNTLGCFSLVKCQIHLKGWVNYSIW